MYFRSFSVLSLRADGNYHKVNQRVKLNVTSLSKISQKVSELLSIEQMAMVGVKRKQCIVVVVSISFACENLRIPRANSLISSVSS
jgi:hypothetical protein